MTKVLEAQFQHAAQFRRHVIYIGAFGRAVRVTALDGGLVVIDGSIRFWLHARRWGGREDIVACIKLAGAGIVCVGHALGLRR